jgi:hypothetical protein
VSIGWNPYHVAAIVVILPACGVMLWLIWREAKVFKLNINIDCDIAASRDGSINLGPNKLARFELIWRGTKDIPNDWEFVLLKSLIGRIHPPVTIELLGRKLTMIVDGRNDVMERMVASGIDLPLCKSDGTVDPWSGFKKIKIMLLIRDGELEKARSLGNIYAQQADEGGNEASDQRPKCIVRHDTPL